MSKRFVWLSLIILSLALVLGAGFYDYRIVYARNIQPSVDQEATPVPVSTSTTDHTALSQVSNGIEVQLGTMQVADGYLLANVCFQLPDDQDWLISGAADDVVLTVGDTSISHTGFAETEVKTDSNGKKFYRCDRLSFPVNSSEDLSKFTITIKHLITSVPEQPDCDMIQKKLDQSNTGIKIKCDAGENSFSYIIVAKPAALSDVEARNSAWKFFSNTIDGPWIFETGIK
jgi:hypothetical protein